MKIDALLMDPQDNVVTCVRDVAAGETVVYRCGDEMCEVLACQDIPYCHKIALSDLAAGASVIKYGEIIGELSVPVAKGHLVDHTNLFSVERDYASELIGGAKE